MPKSIRQDCDQFVDKYADIVIKLLIDDLDPKLVCTKLKLCKSTAASKFDEVKGKKKDIYT